jgi:LTXXQ motif family protein
MRKIVVGIGIALLSAAIFSPSSGEAFGLNLGPVHLGLPLFGYRHHYRHRIDVPPAAQTKGLRDEADLNAVQPAHGLNSAPLYPVLTAPGVIDDIFWPSSSPWPFSYDAIFQAAFGKAPSNQDQQLCGQPNRETAIVARIKSEIRPTGAALQQLQRLAGALDVASSYLAKTCPNEIPAQPVARVQLMEWQTEKLAEALDIFRQPLQDFQQSLNDRQKSRFAAMSTASAGRTDRPENIVSACTATPLAVDRSVEQITQSVEPIDAQRDALATMKEAFRAAASELDGYCPTPSAATPLERLEATESRLDATWRAEVSVQAALARFEKGLNDQQRARFDATEIAAAR